MMKTSLNILISLTVLLAVAPALDAQNATSQSCGGKDPVGYLGISGIDCSCTTSSPGGKAWSFRTEPRITSLEMDARAASILRIDDVITHVNGKLITTQEGAQEFANIKPGEPVILTIRRNGQMQQFALTPEAVCPTDTRLLGNYTPTVRGSTVRGSTPRAAVAPSLPQAYGTAPRAAQPISPQGSFGMGLSCRGNCTISMANAEKGKRAQMRFSEPPEVYSIERGGPAEKAGIRRGDFLTHINDKPMDSSEGGQIFANVQPGETVKFTIERNSARKTVSVKAIERSTPSPQLAQSSEALVRARTSLTELQREQTEQMRRLQEQLKNSKAIDQEKLRELQRDMLQQEREHNARLATVAKELSRVDSQMRAAMADSIRSACAVPMSAPSAPGRANRTLRYTGTLADAEIEVRGSNPVSVTESGDEIVITTGGTIVRVKKTR